MSDTDFWFYPVPTRHRASNPTFIRCCCTHNQAKQTHLQQSNVFAIIVTHKRMHIDTPFSIMCAAPGHFQTRLPITTSLQWPGLITLLWRASLLHSGCVCMQTQTQCVYLCAIVACEWLYSTSPGWFHNYPTPVKLTAHVWLFKVLFVVHTHTLTGALCLNPIMLFPSFSRLPVIHIFCLSCPANRPLAVFEALHGIYKGLLS